MDARTRDLVDTLYLLIMGSLPVPEYPGVMMADIIETYDACVRAEAKAEERREAAERAVAWQINLCKQDDWKCAGCTECADLRTAILADQPKNTNSKVKIIDPGPGGIDGIMTFADQAPEAGKVEGPQAFNTILACALCGETKGTPYKSGDICPACAYGRLRRVERRIQEGR